MKTRALPIHSVPATVQDRLTRLGENIRVARKRRGYTAQRLAELAGVSRPLLSRLEAGHPGVAVGALLSVLWALQLDEDFELLAAPERDQLGQALAKAELPRRVREKERLKYDF